MEGLRSSLREKFIKPYQNFRGNAKKPGTRISFENFVQERPDGGEILTRNGIPIGRARREWEERQGKWTSDQLLNAPLSAMGELFVMGGIDPFQATMNELLSRDDDFKWLVGPWIADIVWRGYIGEPARPALWSALCFQIGAPAIQESLKRVKLWFTGTPAATGEGEQIPGSKLGHLEETISWKKTAWKLEMSNEFLRFSPIPVIEPWLQEVGRIMQVTKDLACVDAIVNGTTSTGNESCPIIGVKDGKALQYVDFLEPWALGDYIGQKWFTLLYPRGMSETIGQIDEFKLRYLGTQLVVLRNSPEPAMMDRYISPSVPDNQIVLVDTMNCVRERVSIPFHIMNDDDMDTYSQALAFFESYSFEKVGEKSCIGIDQTLERGTEGQLYGIPSWMELGQHRPV